MGDRKGENAERSAIMWKQMLWSLRTGFGPLIKMAENVLTVSEAMPRAPALRSSNFSSLQMQRYIYAERAVNISLTPTSSPLFHSLVLSGSERDNEEKRSPWSVLQRLQLKPRPCARLLHCYRNDLCVWATLMPFWCLCGLNECQGLISTQPYWKVYFKKYISLGIPQTEIYFITIIPIIMTFSAVIILGTKPVFLNRIKWIWV